MKTLEIRIHSFDLLWRQIYQCIRVLGSRFFLQMGFIACILDLFLFHIIIYSRPEIVEIPIIPIILPHQN